MIEEAYVNYEVAKLLKEKGFNIPCRFNYRSMYPNTPKLFYHKSLKDFNSEEYKGLRSEWFSAPTQSLVMRWLREVHNLYVNVCPAVGENYFAGKYRAYIDKLKERYPFQQYINDYDTPEEACEAAIKYCLEKLI